MASVFIDHSSLGTTARGTGADCRAVRGAELAGAWSQGDKLGRMSQVIRCRQSRAGIGFELSRAGVRVFFGAPPQCPRVGPRMS